MLGRPEKEDKKAKLDSAWKKGCWLGKSTVNDAHIIGNAEGIFLCRSVRSLPEGEEVDKSLLESITGTSLDMKGK